MHGDRAGDGSNDDNNACTPPHKKEKLNTNVDFWASWYNMHAHHQQMQQADIPSLTDLAEDELAKYVAAQCQPRLSGARFTKKLTTYRKFIVTHVVKSS